MSYYESILKKDPCVFCGEYGQPSIEHIHPKIFGGPKRAWYNLAGACRKCNNRRGCWSVLEFLMRRADKSWKGGCFLRSTPVIPLKSLSGHEAGRRDYPLHYLLGIKPPQHHFPKR